MSATSWTLAAVALNTAVAGEVEVLHYWTAGGEAKSAAELKKIMQAKADEAVILTREKTGVILDWSDESIRQAEILLDNIYNAYYTKKHRTEAPGIEIIRLTYALGCYIGEVYRRCYQAQWGIMGGKSGKLLGLKTPSGLVFSPVEHALERAFDGRRESFNHYSQT